MLQTKIIEGENLKKREKGRKKTIKIKITKAQKQEENHVFYD